MVLILYNITGMIRRYGNTIFNLTKVVRVNLYNKKLTFTLQTRDGISGNFMFFIGGRNTEELRFETENLMKLMILCLNIIRRKVYFM